MFFAFLLFFAGSYLNHLDRDSPDSRQVQTSLVKHNVQVWVSQPLSKINLRGEGKGRKFIFLKMDIFLLIRYGHFFFKLHKIWLLTSEISINFRIK